MTHSTCTTTNLLFILVAFVVWLVTVQPFAVFHSPRVTGRNSQWDFVLFSLKAKKKPHKLPASTFYNVKTWLTFIVIGLLFYWLRVSFFGAPTRSAQSILVDQLAGPVPEYGKWSFNFNWWFFGVLMINISCLIVFCSSCSSSWRTDFQFSFQFFSQK